MIAWITALIKFLKTPYRKRKLKKNYQSKRYRYAADGITKVYLGIGE